MIATYQYHSKDEGVSSRFAETRFAEIRVRVRVRLGFRVRVRVRLRLRLG